jgi:hypothetical protein
VVIIEFPPNCLYRAHANPFLMSGDAQKRAKARANVLMQEMPPYELPQARQLSHEPLAHELHVKQANVSKRVHLDLAFLHRGDVRYKV